MSENAKISAFEKKLNLLKNEEQFILKLLKNIQSQLKKFEVEELQICSELSHRESEEEESDSDDNFGNSQEMLQKVLDCAEFVNDASLNLSLKRILKDDSNEEEDEEAEND